MRRPSLSELQIYMADIYVSHPRPQICPSTSSGTLEVACAPLLKKEITMMAKSLDAFLPLPDDRIVSLSFEPWIRTSECRR